MSEVTMEVYYYTQQTTAITHRALKRPVLLPLQCNEQKQSSNFLPFLVFS